VKRAVVVEDFWRGLVSVEVHQVHSDGSESYCYCYRQMTLLLRAEAHRIARLLNRAWQIEVVS